MDPKQKRDKFCRIISSVILMISLTIALASPSNAAFAQSSVQLLEQVDEWIGLEKMPTSQSAWVTSSGGLSESYFAQKWLNRYGTLVYLRYRTSAVVIEAHATVMECKRCEGHT
jgi:hypothetical protein